MFATNIQSSISLVLCGLGVLLAVDGLLSPRCPDFELRGRRAGKRQRALAQAPWFLAIQPVLEFFSAYAVMLPVPHLRARLEIWLRQADEPLGLAPSEVIAFSLMLSLALVGVGALAVSVWVIPVALLIGLYLPCEMVRGSAQERLTTISRSIPTMTDLLVLSMEAGLDFLGAVRMILHKTTVADGKMPVRDELLVFVQQLQLGRSRRAALTHLSERVPTEAVRALTVAIIQGEEKGMPLRDVLRIQAEVLRHRRVQEAEAHIQTANIQMLAPIMLVLAALLALIVVPVVLAIGNDLTGGSPLGAGGTP